MKPAFESVALAEQQSFLVRRFEEKAFSAPYHFHPEYELTLIVRGSGKRYVGTHLDDFRAGDLVLLGSNLPHCWKTESGATGPSISIVVQFRDDFLGDTFFGKSEMLPVAHLLQRSPHGLCFTGNTARVQRAMHQLVAEHEPFKKLLLLLDVLHLLAHSTSYTTLDTQRIHTNLPHAEQERIRDVMAYIVEHFQNRISLREAAAVAHLTPPAFCKYFKRLTRKTFIEAVTDYRIAYAARQLVHTGKAVTQIGLDSGFDDSAHFYKTFRRRMKQSPLHYRNAFARNGM